jgi:heptosyltransferase-2
VTTGGRTVLVIGPSWVGDMVMTQSFLLALLRQGDVEAVDVVAPAGSLPILERIPEVREAFLLDAGPGRLGVGARIRTARQLRARRYDQCYVLPSSLKSAVLPALAGIPVRTGHRGEFRYGLINDMRQVPDFAPGTRDRNVRGYLSLLGSDVAKIAAPPQPRLRVDEANQRALVQRFDLDTDARVVALAPGGAYGPAKRWPVEHFRALAALLASAGRAVWVVGGPDDRPLGDEILGEGVSSGINLCGRTSLPDAVDLLALADVTVANDSGLAHVAGAVGRGVVVLFGPTFPRFAAPLTDRTELLWLDLECSPCSKRTCPLGHHRCLRDIAPETVFGRVGGLSP